MMKNILCAAAIVFCITFLVMKSIKFIYREIQNEKDEEDSFPEISELPNNQVEMTSITMFINQYNEQPYEDQYINQLTHLFEINNQSQQ